MAVEQVAHRRRVHATADALWKAIYERRTADVERLMAELKSLTEGQTVLDAA